MNKTRTKLVRLTGILMATSVVLAGVLTFLVLDTYFLEDGGKASGKAVIYPFPEGLPSSADCKVTVNSEDCFVYETNVNFRHQSPLGNSSDVMKFEKTPVASFDMDGPVRVTVTMPGMDITSAKVTPQALGIKATVKGNTVSFLVKSPGQLTVEFNDSQSRALHLFANELETEIPNQNDPNVIYFGPGVHNANMISLKADQTLYLAGGAIVRGWVVGSKADNARIIGRGYFDGSVFERYGPDGTSSNAKVPIHFENSKNITVEGVSCLDPAGWTLNTYHCENVVIDNVKIISSRQNGDGITTQSCVNQRVTNCFVRSWDDSLVVKSYEGDTKDIFFDNCILWTDLAQSCEVGFETRGDKMENIHFTNITVLHNFHKSVLSIHNGDHATIKGVYYEHIVVEDAQMGGADGWNFLTDILIEDGIWSKESERGQVRDVYFTDIKIIGGNAAANRIKGFDSEHTVQGIHYKDVVILDKKITSLKDGNFITNPYISEIEFE